MSNIQNQSTTIAAMTFVLTKPQQELEPIMTQIYTGSGSGSGRMHVHTNHHLSSIPSFSLSPSKRRRGKRPSRCCHLSALLILMVTFLMSLPYLFSSIHSIANIQSIQMKGYYSNNSSNGNSFDADPNVDSPKTEKRDKAPAAQQALIKGVVGEGGIAYYHQPAPSPSEENHHVVLLHGAAFTKEEWKTSGIMGVFQRDFPSITVTALDLPVTADHTVLEAVLRSMRDEDLVTQLPISALVTPSASGKTVTSWIRKGSSEGISSYVSAWIPVASYSVAKCSPQDLETLRAQPYFSILAIHGNRDRKGRDVTSSLKDHSGAETLELPGNHPVYLDSPDAFVSAVGNKVLAIH